MSADFSRFAILAAPVPETVIPEDLITGLELACNQGPLRLNEERQIGTLAARNRAEVIAALNEKLAPLGLAAINRPMPGSAGQEFCVMVCRLATPT